MIMKITEILLKGMGADGFMKKVNYRAAYPELILHLNQEFKENLQGK